MRILIAEDDMVSRRILQMTLAKWGHEVIIAPDGVEALAAFQSKDGQPPPLAISVGLIVCTDDDACFAR